MDSFLIQQNYLPLQTSICSPSSRFSEVGSYPMFSTYSLQYFKDFMDISSSGHQNESHSGQTNNLFCNGLKITDIIQSCPHLGHGTFAIFSPSWNWISRQYFTCTCLNCNSYTLFPTSPNNTSHVNNIGAWVTRHMSAPFCPSLVK
jgi:hypothetical protein